MKKVVILLAISLILISSASAAYYDRYFDVPTGKTGDQVCVDNGGICAAYIHKEVVCKIQLGWWWGNYCGGKDCSWKNTNPNGWIKANCLCENTQPYCDGSIVKKRESNCQEYTVKNCAVEDRICSGSNCGRCVDVFHDENEICVLNEQECQASCVNGIGATGTKTWTNRKWGACISTTTCASCNTGYHLENGVCMVNSVLSCASPALSGTGILTNIGSPTSSNQVWVYDGTSPYNACSWRCDTTSHLENGVCMVNSVLSCASPALSGTGILTNIGSPTSSNQVWVYDGTSPYNACSWRCDTTSGYNKGTGNNCVVADTIAPTVTVSYTNGKIYATTSEKATCRYATSNIIAYDSMSSMTCETGDCKSHVKTISLAGVTVYVKCRDTAVIPNEGMNSVNIPIVQPSCKTSGTDCSNICSGYWCSSNNVCLAGKKWTGAICEEASIKCKTECGWEPSDSVWTNLGNCIKSVGNKKQVCCEVNWGGVVVKDWCDVTEIK